MPLINSSDAQGPYFKKKGKNYPKFHYPAGNKALREAAKARALKSKKIKAGSERTPQFKALNNIRLLW